MATSTRRLRNSACSDTTLLPEKRPCSEVGQPSSDMALSEISSSKRRKLTEPSHCSNTTLKAGPGRKISTEALPIFTSKFLQYHTCNETEFQNQRHIVRSLAAQVSHGRHLCHQYTSAIHSLNKQLEQSKEQQKSWTVYLHHLNTGLSPVLQRLEQQYPAQSVSETPVSDITPPPLFTPVLADDETHPKAECVQTERTVQSAISRLQAEPRSTPTVHDIQANKDDPYYASRLLLTQVRGLVRKLAAVPAQDSASTAA